MPKVTSYLLLLSLILGLHFKGLAQTNRDPMDTGGPMIAEQTAYDVTHYALELEVIPDKKSIQGSNEISLNILQPTQFITFDLDDYLAVAEVSVVFSGKKKGKKVKFEQQGGRIRLDLKKQQPVGSQLRVRVEYGGVPRPAQKAPWIGGFSWATAPDGSPWVAVSCQVNGADLWYPCKDHQSDEPDSMSIKITVPKGLTAVSNGLLRSSNVTGDKSQFHWATNYPINNYAVTINIGNYELFEDTYTSITGKKLPLKFYKLAGTQQDGKSMVLEMRNAISFLEKKVGPYPFQNEKCGAVHAPFVGMEHQSLVAIDTTVKKNSGGYNYVLFHELAHEWFGNQLTAKDWGHFWLQEGLATYYEILFHESKTSESAYLIRIKDQELQIKNEFPMASDAIEEGRKFYFRDTDYISKGVCMLHILRSKMGLDELIKGVRLFAGPKGQTQFVDTRMFQAALEKSSAMDLKSIFQAYAYQAELPKLIVHEQNNKIELQWESKAPFTETVEVLWYDQLNLVAMPEGKGELGVCFGRNYQIDPNQKLIIEGPVIENKLAMTQEQYLDFLIGQMILVGIQGTKPSDDPALLQAIKDNKVGSVIIYGKNISDKNSKQKLKTLIDSLHAASQTLPLVVAIDQEGGLVNRLKTKYGFPASVSAMHLGKINNADSTYHYGRITGRTLRSLGINVNFAPVMDLCSYAENPIIAGVQRCYSDDPKDVAMHGIATIRGHHEFQVGTSLKHFPGHGSSHADTHLGMADVTDYWTKEELYPFKAIIDSGLCDAIMTAHIVNRNLSPKGLPATLSREINYDLLRKKWGFEGVIFTDDMQMKAISKHYGLKESIYLALNSDVDILLFSNNIAGVEERTVDQVHKIVRELLADGRITQRRIEKSFERIVKFKLSLIVP